MNERDRQRHLAAVIELGRAELRDRDADDIPHKLRTVAQSSARRLPPPLARALLDHVASDEEFRQALSERVGDGPIPPVARDYLKDPDATTEELERLSNDDSAAELATQLTAARGEAEVLTRKLDEAKARLKRAEERHARELHDATERHREARGNVDRRLTEEARARTELERERDALVEQTKVLEAEVASLRDRLRRREERRAKSTADAAAREASRESDPEVLRLPTEPVAIARALDDLVDSLKYYRDPARHVPGQERHERPMEFERGVRPDTVDGVRSVLALDPDRIVIDGYNLAGQLGAGVIGSRTSRDSAVRLAERLASRTSAAVVVVFDAGDSTGRDVLATETGVTIQFSPSGTIADDLIAEMVATSSDRCVVVTSDRDLQSRCTRSDCVVVYSEALLGYMDDPDA